jgi:arabinan endo-1,5-alpha-L-arabinosidase
MRTSFLHAIARAAGLAAVCLALCAAFRPPRVLRLTGDTEGVHDPSAIKSGRTYYLFSTGFAHPGIIPIRCSPDLILWRSCGHVFDAMPGWATREIRGARTIWAPDISRHKQEYRLYYAVSTFGHNDSAIGLAVNATLDASSPKYQWIDRGMVIRSRAGRDDWNAIDPNLAVDAHGGEWLVFGSFWGGIKMRRIDSKTGMLDERDTTLYSLAARPHGNGRPNAVEAPFVIRHADKYYLFASFDYCCRGANSTYNIVVGRSRDITGPYVDESGRLMNEGGGTQIEAGTPDWRGPGGVSVLQSQRRDWLIFHTYDGHSGRPYLQISMLAWRDGWPVAGPLPE